MKLLVTTDAHIFRTSDGKLWCKSIYSYSFWKRYLTVFDEVRVVARLKDVEIANDKWLRVDGPSVEIYGIPFFQGPIQLMRKYLEISKSLREVYIGCDAALFRMPSPTGQLVYNSKRSNIPCAVEVVYDPTDDLKSKSGGVIRHYITRKIAYDLKKICLKANGVSYVTSETIQKNFPSFARKYGEDSQHFESFYSTITLDKDAFGEPKTYIGKNTFTIAHSDVSMNTERKGEPVLLEAIKIVRDKGFDVKGVFIGDGTLRSKFEKKAKDLGIDDFVEFTGLLASASEVRQKLKDSDMYVFPTLAEGLPRGIIEAMAVGLPCISSPVGGIPELLDKEYLAAPKDVNAYVEIIIKLISSPEKMEVISSGNIEKARKFRNDILQERRNVFYSQIADLALKYK